MDNRKYQTMAVQQPIHADQSDLYERDYYNGAYPQEPAEPAKSRRFTLERVLLLLSLAVGAITHGYHLFLYPLYITDEGIYMERAWSVMRYGILSPYTYYYDHAPAGWLFIAAWVTLLPHQFETFGNAINTGRVFMLLIHIASTYLLFKCTRRLSGSVWAAVIACFFFNVSPLAVYYQRQVLLDNMMVFWVLLSLYLATSDDRRIMTPLFSGLALGVSVLTKENAIFFIPIIGYLLYARIRPQRNYRFALTFWLFGAFAIISLYFLYAMLKNELLPAQLDFNLNTPPADHVSLLYTIWQQLHRNQGSILDIHSDFWTFSLDAWLPKDAFILVAGTGATLVNLLTGLRDRKRYQGELVASLLSLAYIFYLVRGSVMLEFYVIPLIPFLAVNLGMVVNRMLHVIPEAQRLALLTGGVRSIILAMFFTVLILPTGSYVLVHDQYGKTVPHDLYKLPLTPMQEEQLAFIRAHIPPNATVIMDDDLWMQLHDVRPYYPYAVSHWNAAGDPAVRNKIFHDNWQNIDYIVMSNKMLTAMQQNNTDGSENYILEALQHARPIWQLTHGDVSLAIYQVEH
ncbi:MAG TPA: glycosyltransferase family 39 protein [Ktedonobacteraceae bacterium]|nr:glycosyltransferase family 39 protein [Ktedonobacteraceae bacterium]